jgi:hypothetical protein
VAGLHDVVVLAASICSSAGMGNGATNGQEEEDGEENQQAGLPEARASCDVVISS